MPAADLEVLRKDAHEQLNSAAWLTRQLLELLSAEERNPGDLIWRESVVRILSLLKRHWDAADAEFAGAEGRLVDQLRLAGYRCERSDRGEGWVTVHDVAIGWFVADVSAARRCLRSAGGGKRLSHVFERWLEDEKNLVALPE